MAETLLQHLYQEKLIEIRGQIGFQNYRYAMLERGWQRANRLLDLNGYIGPAPVSLQAYTDMVSRQRQGPGNCSNWPGEIISGKKGPETIRQDIFGPASGRAKNILTPPWADKIFTLSSGKSEKIL